MPRLFVALEVPSGGLLPVAIFPPGQPPHVTLQFLGEVSKERSAAIPPALSEATAAARPFPYQLRGIGAFPSSRKPRVVWVGFGLGAEDVERLAGGVRTSLIDAGFEGETRRFVPHVTLFRVRGPHDARRARELIGEHPGTEFGDGRGTEILLKESQLNAGGATHSVVQRFPLGGPPSNDAP